PNDSLMNVQLAQAYYTAYILDLGDDNAQLAIDYLDKSLALSPERLPVHYLKANILLSEGRKEEAVATLEPLVELNPDYPDTYCNLFKAYRLLDEPPLELVSENADKCLALGGAEVLGMSQDFLNLLAHYYEKGDWDKSAQVVEILTQYQPENVDSFLLLAEVYNNLGDEEKSQAALERASLLYGAQLEAEETTP
ncbi:MAG: tetratricopeptide repeat protein, partial [Candidatus Moranbacteria bacterium]|nr:tetratricopeptide repeat protein [Candidatus Moranbacteria bacterium]